MEEPARSISAAVCVIGGRADKSASVREEPRPPAACLAPLVWRARPRPQVGAPFLLSYHAKRELVDIAAEIPR